MDENITESDRQKFIRLANRRVNNAIKHIRLIGNLSNTSNYDYTDEHVDKIFAMLRHEVEESYKCFESKKKVKPSFSLEE